MDDNTRLQSNPMMLPLLHDGIEHHDIGNRSRDHAKWVSLSI